MTRAPGPPPTDGAAAEKARYAEISKGREQIVVFPRRKWTRR